MLIRQLKCPQCGAPKEASDGAMVMFCDFCGSYISVQSTDSMSAEEMVQMGASALQRLTDPTEMERRWQELGGLMNEQAEAGNRREWRLLADEFFPMQPLMQPEVVPEEYRDGSEMREWIIATTAVAELCLFDERIRAEEARCTAVVQELYTGGDPVEGARKLLAARVHFNDVLFAHPDYPDLVQGSAEANARDIVRATVNALRSVIGGDAVDRIKVEVLGDRPAGGAADARGLTCNNCGAAIDEAVMATGQCPYCGGRLETGAAGDDPLLEQMVSMFQMAAASLPDENMKADTAFTFAFMNGPAMGVPATADNVSRFLDRTVSDLPPAVMAGALQRAIAMHGASPEAAAVLAEVAKRYTG